MREIRSEIFMGNGDQSLIGVYKLHQKVEEAVYLLNGLQQPPRSQDKKEADNYRKLVIEYEGQLKDIVLDVAVGLGINRFLKTQI